MEEVFKQILETAVYAPSGDNMQPWRFVIENNTLFVYNVPEKDPTLFNYKQRAAYISHGALLENIALTAPTLGFTAHFEYFPVASDGNLTAKVTLSETEKSEPPLFRFIKLRSSNRKPYKDIPLTAEQKSTLQGIFSSSPVSIIFIGEKENKEKAAAAICQSDRMIFENKTIHDFLFAHIRWTDEQVQAEKDGFNLKTMELAPPQVAAFKLFKNWNTMKVFNAIGFPKLAVKSNFPLYAKASALVTLQIPNKEPGTFLELGRLLQRFWLTATSLGLSMHPLTAIPLLMQRINEQDAKELADYQIDMIKNSYKIIAETSGTGSQTIGFMFRIGTADPPSGTSPRLAPKIEIK